MNRRLLSGLSPVLLALPFSFLNPCIAHAQSDAQTSVPNQFLVRWKSQKAPLVLAKGVDASPWQQGSLKSQISAKLSGVKVESNFSGSGWSVVSVPKGANSAQTRQQLAAALGQANVSPDYKRELAKTPNDPMVETQWHLKTIKAYEAWDVNTGNGKVVVGVIDSGVDLNHPDIKANLWKNPFETTGNGKDDDGNGYIDDINGLNAVNTMAPPQDNYGHGTHVSGLIGATGDNNVDVTGTAWNVKIMALKYTEGRAGEDSDIIRCIEYAVKMKQKGVNLRVLSSSLSGGLDNPALKDAYQLAAQNGILCVCAAGNSSAGSNNDAKPQYPASYSSPYIISVAASNARDQRATFSNYGPTSVDIAAPGDNILSTVPPAVMGSSTGYDSGTSMATPIVAGAAALIAMKEPSLTALQIKERLLTTVDVLPDFKTKVVSGGRLNLRRALTNTTLKLSGQVYRLDGTTRAGLVGATIKIKGKIVASTDRNGKYDLGEVAPGKYDITVTLNGYAFPAASITLVTGNTSNNIVDFQATRIPAVLYNISGYCLDSGGIPQKNVPIYFVGSPTPVAYTATNGKYIISGRGKGTYKLSAGGDTNLVWTPSRESVTVPAPTGTAGAPHGIMDFSATVPDTAAPAVTITTPVNGSTFAPSQPIAMGRATDATGLKTLKFELSRVIGFEYMFYDWTNRVWTSERTAPGTIGAKAVSGTSVNWGQQLPSLIAGTYQLTVSGVDTLNNESRGQADAVSGFTVAASGQITKSSATAAVTPSGKAF